MKYYVNVTCVILCSLLLIVGLGICIDMTQGSSINNIALAIFGSVLIVIGGLGLLLQVYMYNKSIS